MTIDQIIQSLREAHAKATPGHWELWYFRPDTNPVELPAIASSAGTHEHPTLLVGASDFDREEDNIGLATLAHNHLPALLDEIERLREANDGAMREDRDRLLLEIERLRAIVDQIPKYQDTGETIMPGDAIAVLTHSVLHGKVVVDGAGIACAAFTESDDFEATPIIAWKHLENARMAAEAASKEKA